MDEAKKQIVGYAEVLFEGHRIPCAVGDDLYVYIPIRGVYPTSAEAVVKCAAHLLSRSEKTSEDSKVCLQ